MPSNCHQGLRASKIGLFSIGFGVVRGYIIDDTNSTIQYSGYGDVLYPHVNDTLFDNTRIFNSTLTDLDCFQDENCHIRIPFVGSGVTVYNAIVFPVNASFSVDGSPSQTYIYDNSCFHSACYNVSVYNVQSLTYGNHTLEIATFSYGTIDSTFYLDYVVINDTNPLGIATTTSSTVTSSSSTTVTPSPTPTPVIPGRNTHLSRKQAVAIGGSLGGLAAIGAVVLVLLCLRKRNRSQSTTDTVSGHTRNPCAFIIDSPISPSPAISHSMSPGSILPMGLSNYEQSSSSLPASMPISNIHPQMIAATHLPMSASATQGLTELQMDSIQTLLRHNVPGPIVANVMESMRRGEGPSTSTIGDGLRAGNFGTSGTPGYTFQ